MDTKQRIRHAPATLKNGRLTVQEVSSPKNRMYKVDAEVLKFLKKRNAEEKLKRKFPDQESNKKIVRVKVKKPKLASAEDRNQAKVPGPHKPGRTRSNHQRGKAEDCFKLKLTDHSESSLEGHPSPVRKEHTTLGPSHQILSKLSHVKGSVPEIIEQVNSVLKGQGRVSFVAVKGSCQVSRVTEKAFIPVPQDLIALHESSESDDEGNDDTTLKTLSPKKVHAGTGSDVITSEAVTVDMSQYSKRSKRRPPDRGQHVMVQVQGIPGSGVESDASTGLSTLSKMPYKCVRCKSKPFSTQLELDIHMSCHVTQGPDLLIYRCPETNCTVERRCYPRMVEHLIMQHPSYEKQLQGTQTYDSVAGSFQCNLCSLEFKLKVNLQTHIKKIHGSESRRIFSRKCDRCGVSFNKISLAAFNLHRERCSYEYRCSQCDYRTNKVKNIELHLKVHTGEGCKCQVCDKWFANKARLNAHSKIHMEDRPKFVCEICYLVFAHNDALKKHKRRMHEEVEKLKCSQCSYETKMQADLNKHELFVHRKVFHCAFENCEFQTNSQKFWNEHLDYHKPENIFGCPFEDCYYRAETEEKVSHHLNGFHKINAKHQCPMCSKFFFKKTQLMRHLVTHSGQKVYTCDECKASFVSHTGYYKHRHKTGHDEGRGGVISVPQNIQIIQYQEERGSEPSEANTVTHLEEAMQEDQNPVVMYSDNQGILLANHEGVGSVETGSVQVINASEIISGSDQKDQDTKIIYMDDCDEATKALILKELQKGYHVADNNTVEGAMHMNYTPQESGQLVTISAPEGNVLFDDGQGGVVLFDHSAVQGEGGMTSSLTEVTTDGFQIMDSTEDQYTHEMAEFTVQAPAETGQFEMASTVSSAGSLEEGSEFIDPVNIDVVSGVSQCENTSASSLCIVNSHTL